MTHVLDDLELYALGALTSAETERVARHLAGCASCRTAASELADVVAQLPNAIPLREPRPELKVRILEAARAESRPARAWLGFPWSWPRLGFAAMSVAAAVLLAVDIGQARALRDLQEEAREYDTLVMEVAHGGRSWYMAGIDQWRGMGGNLMQPSTSDAAVILFHDLRGLPADQMYAVWLIAPDGHWVRGANVHPDGRPAQKVTLAVDARGFDWCAVTIERSAEGKHAGPTVMESVKGALLTQ